MNITIYAEKADVGLRIASAFGGININNKQIHIDDFAKYKDKITKEYSRRGFIEVPYDGDNYFITWGWGHMLTLKDVSDYDKNLNKWSKIPLPFYPNDYELKIRPGYDFKTKKRLPVDPSTKRQLDNIKNLFLKSDYIINTTDNDREGELIFSYVYEYIGVNKPYKRAIVESFTEESVKKAFKKENLKDMTDVYTREQAGRARSIADWAVGINLTVATTLKQNNGQMVTVGRVQTPTLKILVDRELEIRNFKPEPLFTPTATFSNNGVEYEGKHIKAPLRDKEVAVEIMNKVLNSKGIVKDVDIVESKTKAPLLYNLTSLSMDANKQFGYTAKETLDIVQDLYSDGLVTYPRTSSAYLPEDMKNEVRGTLELMENHPDFGQYVKRLDKSKWQFTKRHYNDKKVESHYAIIPTNKVKNALNLTGRKKDIYSLIAYSLIRSIYPDAIISKTTIITDVNGEEFKTNGSSIIETSFLDINNNSNDKFVPNVNKGDSFDAEIELKETQTKPPARYNDSTLIAAMKNAGNDIEDEELKEALLLEGDGGIGQESTRAGIIELVVKRYGMRKGKTIYPTDDAIEFINKFPVEDIKSPRMTAEWENKLNEIEKGNIELDDFVKDIHLNIDKWVEIINSSDSLVGKRKPGGKNTKQLDDACPLCKGTLYETKKFILCENYKAEQNACVFLLNKGYGKPACSAVDVRHFAKKGETRVKKAKSSKGKEFSFVYRYDKDKDKIVLSFPNSKTSSKETSLKCPNCNSPIKESAKAFYCSKSCGFFLATTYKLKPKINEKDIQALIERGYTDIKTGVGKTGRDYKAQFVYNKDSNKVDMQFVND